ncbi:MAG: hypothetical protein HYR96_02565 [Deltaproteobacteria bacterium]|nr:hypothetical protein [Deltaproteobacteria bacterium]
MKQLTLVTTFLITFAHAQAHPCPPYVVDTVHSACRMFPETPKLEKVQYDQEKKEFRYFLPFHEITRYTRSHYTCHGRLYFTEFGNRTTQGTQIFAQPEEGHADFTLIREVRAYIKDQPQCD